MSDLDWADIALHNLGAVAIGLIAAFTFPVVIAVNTPIWLTNELIQRRRKRQPLLDVFRRKQVLWEWISPSLTGPLVMLIAPIVERALA